MKERCDSCRYWKPAGDLARGTGFRGRCHRFPFVAHLGGYPMHAGAPDPQKIRIISAPTDAAHWCGEWRRQKP